MKEDKNTFEELLDETFLELDFDAPENEVLLDATAESVLGATTMFGVSFGERLLDVLVSKWGVVGAIIIGLGSFLATKITTSASNYTPHYSQLEETIYQEELIVFNQKKETLFQEKNLEVTDYYQPSKMKQNHPNLLPSNANIPAESKKKERLGAIPLITYEAIAENKKAKEELFRRVSKLSKQKLAKIKVNQGQPTEGNTELADFAMWKTEVTNREYRIFLQDLLIQKNYSDYYKANVVDDAWINSFENAFNEPLARHYFSHPAYDEYPVVNISRMGAEMFCAWLSKGLEGLPNRDKSYAVRIPTAQEWVYAASVGGKNETFPWGTLTVKNKHENYLANFRPEKNNFSLDGGLHTVKVDSYNPNDFGLYNMSGNVAEMVRYNTHTVGTKGGSWFSEEEEIKINGKDPYVNKKGAHPTIGFRPVILVEEREGVARETIKEKKVLEKAERNYIPSLSEEQRVLKNKAKYELIHRFIKFDKGLLSKGFEEWSPKNAYENFVFQTTEVTNEEYRAFLFDLIDQKKYKEFEIAKPKETKWKEQEDLLFDKEVYTKHYFTHPAYNRYPVVNVSVEGAKMYCKWLFEEIKRADTKGKFDFVRTIRLPKVEEWIKVASNGNDQQVYPWDSEGTRNTSKKYKGEFLANYKHDGNNRFRKTEKLKENSEITTNVFSYWPNAKGIYNLAGNVAEIVSYADGEYGSKGGHWNSSAEELKVFAVDRTKGALEPSPMLGFRILVEFSRVLRKDDGS